MNTISIDMFRYVANLTDDKAVGMSITKELLAGKDRSRIDSFFANREVSVNPESAKDARFVREQLFNCVEQALDVKASNAHLLNTFRQNLGLDGTNTGNVKAGTTLTNREIKSVIAMMDALKPGANLTALREIAGLARGGFGEGTDGGEGYMAFANGKAVKFLTHSGERSDFEKGKVQLTQDDKDYINWATESLKKELLDIAFKLDDGRYFRIQELLADKTEINGVAFLSRKTVAKVVTIIAEGLKFFSWDDVSRVKSGKDMSLENVLLKSFHATGDETYELARTIFEDQNRVASFDNQEQPVSEESQSDSEESVLEGSQPQLEEHEPEESQPNSEEQVHEQLQPQLKESVHEESQPNSEDQVHEQPQSNSEDQVHEESQPHPEDQEDFGMFVDRMVKSAQKIGKTIVNAVNEKCDELKINKVREFEPAFNRFRADLLIYLGFDRGQAELLAAGNLDMRKVDFDTILEKYISRKGGLKDLLESRFKEFLGDLPEFGQEAFKSLYANNYTQAGKLKVREALGPVFYKLSDIFDNPIIALGERYDLSLAGLDRQLEDFKQLRAATVVTESLKSCFLGELNRVHDLLKNYDSSESYKAVRSLADQAVEEALQKADPAGDDEEARDYKMRAASVRDRILGREILSIVQDNCIGKDRDCLIEEIRSAVAAEIEKARADAVRRRYDTMMARCEDAIRAKFESEIAQMHLDAVNEAFSNLLEYDFGRIEIGKADLERLFRRLPTLSLDAVKKHVKDTFLDQAVKNGLDTVAKQVTEYAVSGLLPEVILNKVNQLNHGFYGEALAYLKNESEKYMDLRGRRDVITRGPVWVEVKSVLRRIAEDRYNLYKINHRDEVTESVEQILQKDDVAFAIARRRTDGGFESIGWLTTETAANLNRGIGEILIANVLELGARADRGSVVPNFNFRNILSGYELLLTNVQRTVVSALDTLYKRLTVDELKSNFGWKSNYVSADDMRTFVNLLWGEAQNLCTKVLVKPELFTAVVDGRPSILSGEGEKNLRAEIESSIAGILNNEAIANAVKGADPDKLKAIKNVFEPLPKNF